MNLNLETDENKKLVSFITDEISDDTFDEVEALIIILAKKLKRNKITSVKPHIVNLQVFWSNPTGQSFFFDADLNCSAKGLIDQVNREIVVSYHWL